ncbi:MAG: radical SAM protein [Victivallales bacterium]|nr:radical SAM protein [Victivallales bacterium]
MNGKYVFGPIPSRRLGRSLGIDLVPHKTCSNDCIYCEAGATTLLTLERKEYVPVDDVIRELDAVLKADPELDYLTFSGAGEPTLNRRIGDVVAFVRRHYPQYRLCLLTNGSLLGDPEVAAAVKDIDLIIPSLDASCEEEFATINRAQSLMSLAALVDALTRFRKTFTGAYWLEVFVVPGVNDSEAAIDRSRRLIAAIRPDKVQLNTLDRPGCVSWLKPASETTLRHFVARLHDLVPVEAVGRFHYQSYEDAGLPEDELKDRIVDIVSRRPGTADDIAAALALSRDHAIELLHQLSDARIVRRTVSRRGIFYCKYAP